MESANLAACKDRGDIPARTEKINGLPPRCAAGAEAFDAGAFPAEGFARALLENRRAALSA